MRWWWLIALAGCPSKPAKQKPHDAAIAIARDAATIPDAMVMTPQPGEVAVPGPAPFYIDKLETTIAEYRACVEALACTKTENGIEMHGKHPEEAMGGVTFHQARAFCAWKGKRLPTPAEWKRAAYGDGARTYPWGDEPPTCTRAVSDECKVGGPIAPGGRPTGASPFGAEDMIGNVGEWTDPGPLAFATACVTPPRTHVPMLGGGFQDAAASSIFGRDPPSPDHGIAWGNRDQGIRCARGPIPAAPSVTDPVLTAKTWVVTPVASARAAVLEVARRCKAGEQATWIAGEQIGRKGWAVVTAPATPPPDAITVARPENLVRVVGVASCGFDDSTDLTVKTDAKKWRIDMPTEVGVYQLWLAPGTWATLAIDCEAPETRGECTFTMMRPEPTRFRVPTSMLGVEGPALEADGGTTCD